MTEAVTNEAWIAEQVRDANKDAIAGTSPDQARGRLRNPWTSAARAIVQRLLPWLLPVTLLVVWQLASTSGWLSTRVLPAPSEVAHATFALARSGELWTMCR